jgi:oligoendopeptidase F
MKVVLFLFLFALIVCPPVPTEGEGQEERNERRKKFQQEITDCILKGDISTELKTKLQENKDEDLRKTLHTFLSKLDSNDKEVIRKCRREIFGKLREELKTRRHDSFMNSTHYRHHPFHLERPKIVDKDKE